jgi:hypothetical protein
MIRKLLSRYSAQRKWTIISDTMIEFKAYNVISYTTSGYENNLFSIYPDGGPFIHVGNIIKFPLVQHEIYKIYSFEKKDDVLTVLFQTKTYNQ